MLSKPRKILVALSTLALVSSVFIEVTPGTAQAKSTPATSSVTTAGFVKTATEITSPFGPTCVDPAPSVLRFIAGTTRVVDLSCAKTIVGVNPSPAPTITPTPTSTPAIIPSPAPTSTPIAITDPTPDVTYAIDTATLPVGITASVSPTGVVAIFGTNDIDGNVSIFANQIYPVTQPDYGYTGTTKIIIPVSIRVPAPPTCQIFTTSSLRDTAVNIPLTYDALQAGGCRGGYGNLNYLISANTNGTAIVNGTSATFTPNPGFTTPADNTVKAFFYVTATDEYGQASVALDQFGGAITNATITVNIGTPRACTGATAKSETVFNNPLARSSRDGKLSNSRFAITNRITDMIDCTSAGQTIAMSWFSFTDDNMVNHLIQAKNAGVNVRVLVNSHATKPKSSSFTAVSTLRAALGTTITDATANASTNPGSWLGSCDSGCLTPVSKSGVEFPDDSEGEYPALHSKFFLITQAGSAKNIVGISSINPTYEQARVGFNNASISVGDATLFNSLNQYYADLANVARGAGKATAYRKLASSSKTTSYYVYPKSGSDDVLKMLREVKCIYREGRKTQRTQIYVNMFVFTRNAPAMELWKKAFNSKAKNGGCNVQIIYTDMDQRIKAFNTKTNSWAFIPNGERPSSWGAADCLSTLPKSRKGKPYKLTGPGLVFNADTGRMVAASVCKFGSLNGAMPTINKKGGYCWFKAKAKGSGGTLEMCVSTPLKITALDKADNRAKLEPVADATGARWYTHQKYIAIDGMYGPKGEQKRQQVVISGTPNISSPGLRWNDEILTFTTSAEIYAQHLADFNALKAAILQRPGPGPGSNPNGVTARW